MNKIKKTEKSVDIEHPLEEYFDIPKGSTEVVEYERESELVKSESYDEKDDEIEGNYQEVYDSAMEGYDVMVEELEDCSPQFKARMSEVALQHLTIALNAAKQKGVLKQHKDKLVVSNKPSNTVNNTMVIDRNDLLREILKNREPTPTDIIEGETDE